MATNQPVRTKAGEVLYSWRHTRYEKRAMVLLSDHDIPVLILCKMFIHAPSYWKVMDESFNFWALRGSVIVTPCIAQSFLAGVRKLKENWERGEVEDRNIEHEIKIPPILENGMAAEVLYFLPCRWKDYWSFRIHPFRLSWDGKQYLYRHNKDLFCWKDVHCKEAFDALEGSLQKLLEFGQTPLSPLEERVRAVGIAETLYGSA